MPGKDREIASVTGRRLTRPSRSYFLSGKSMPGAGRRGWQVFAIETQEALGRYILRYIRN